MALYAVALLFGTRVAETILASVHVRAHPQAGHMDASNLIKALQNTLRGGGRPHMGLGRASRYRTFSHGWAFGPHFLPQVTKPVQSVLQPIPCLQHDVPSHLVRN